MFNTSNGYSLADIAAATGGARNNDGYGDGMWGNGAWWIIILFLFCFNGGMWGNGGWGGGANNAGLQGALTRADLCQDMNFQGLENGVRGVQQGLCDGFYAMNTSVLNGFHGVDNAVCTLGYQTEQAVNGVNTNLMQGFNATQLAMMQGQNALQAQLADCCCTTKGAIKDAQFANQVGQNAIQTQLADCCCTLGREIERGFADTAYRMATDTCAIQTSMANNTRDIIDSQNAGTRAILDYLCQEKIADLQSENQTLRLAASQQAQNNYLIDQLKPCPSPAYLVCNPYTGMYGTYGNGFNFNNGGCGCNNGCGNYN